MISVRAWKPEAIVRLLVSMFVCVYAGTLLAAVFHANAMATKPAPRLWLLTVAALGCLGATLVQVRRAWTAENIMRRVMTLLACFYAGLALGAWAHQLAGPAGTSISQMVMATLSFQGAGVVLIALFLREQQTTWDEAFGLANHWRQALLLGLGAGCLLFPLGMALQWVSITLMEHLPNLQLKPQEQQAVHALRSAVSWPGWVAMAVVTVVLAPVAEELLFRGILYPAIKHAGFPRLAVLGTALMFAAMHFNLMTFLPLFVMALVLTALYERANNLMATIIAHSLFNAFNMVQLLRDSSGGGFHIKG